MFRHGACSLACGSAYPAMCSSLRPSLVIPTSQLLDEALAVALQQGYRIRHEHLGGAGTGHFTLKAERWIVLDVAQPTDEQLQSVLDAVAAEPWPAGTPSAELQALLDNRAN